MDMEDDDIYDVGNSYIPVAPFLEVYSVTITKVNNETERRSEVYGRIHVSDGKGNNVAFYDRDLQHSESINPHETLTLTGSPFPALTDFTIDLDLRLRGENQSLVLSKGRISWNKNMQCHNNKFLSLNVRGPHGFATVHFVVYDIALLASVEVLIRQKHEMDDDGNTSSKFTLNTDIYGSVVAHSSWTSGELRSDCKKYFQTTLFRRSRANCLNLEVDKPIPLLRSHVAVPAGVTLVFEVELFGGDLNALLLKGALELLPTKDYRSFIYGKDYIAEVNVYWEHAPSDSFK